jgi:CRP/FNR family cyclic AMP-dependent transcriptional regulator
MKTEKGDDYGRLLMGAGLMLWAVGQPVYGNALGLCLYARERDGKGISRRALEDVARRAPTEGAARTGRAREGGNMGEIKFKKTVAFLAQVPLFRNLDKRQLQSLARSVTPRRYAAGEELVRQGKGGISLFVVVSGKAEAVHTRADGTRVVVNTFGPTDYFGELAMLNDQPRTASVVAVEDIECLALVRWDFLGKLQRHRGMATAILQEQSRRFQRALSVL